jgi:hypothetical protein
MRFWMAASGGTLLWLRIPAEKDQHSFDSMGRFEEHSRFVVVSLIMVNRFVEMIYYMAELYLLLRSLSIRLAQNFSNSPSASEHSGRRFEQRLSIPGIRKKHDVNSVL